MASYEKTESGLLLPKGFERADRHSATKGMMGQMTVIDPDHYGAGYNMHIQPDAEGLWQVQRINPRMLAGMTVRQILEYIYRSSPAMKRCLSIMKRYLNTKMELKASDDRAKGIIERYIERMEMTGKTFGERVDEDIYNMLIEGAYSRETVFNLQGTMAVDSVPVSPMTLRYSKMRSDLYNEKVVIFQYIRGHKVILRDPEDPIYSATFHYYPIDKLGNENPLGNPPVAGVIGNLLMKEELLRTISKWVQGRLMPAEIISISREMLHRAGYEADEIDDIVKGAVARIRASLKANPDSKLHVVDTDINVENLGVLGDIQLTGLQILFSIFDYGIMRALDIPKVLYGIERRGGGLGNNESDVEYQAFLRSNGYYRDILESQYENQFMVVLRSEGHPGWCRPEFDSTDMQGVKMMAETFKTVVEGITQAYRGGFIGRMEGREQIITSDSRFKGYDLEIPDDALDLSEIDMSNGNASEEIGETDNPEM